MTFHVHTTETENNFKTTDEYSETMTARWSAECRTDKTSWIDFTSVQHTAEQSEVIIYPGQSLVPICLASLQLEFVCKRFEYWSFDVCSIL
jgi:hypothetical protein